MHRNLFNISKDETRGHAQLPIMRSLYALCANSAQQSPHGSHYSRLMFKVTSLLGCSLIS